MFLHPGADRAAVTMQSHRIKGDEIHTIPSETAATCVVQARERGSKARQTAGEARVMMVAYVVISNHYLHWNGREGAHQIPEPSHDYTPLRIVRLPTRI